MSNGAEALIHTFFWIPDFFPLGGCTDDDNKWDASIDSKQIWIWEDVTISGEATFPQTDTFQLH